MEEMTDLAEEETIASADIKNSPLLDSSNRGEIVIYYIVCRVVKIRLFRKTEQKYPAYRF
ncbi:MAG: hypothetical protein UT82_C0019G0013 [Parcubacteria group bacterium GW2011_GWB1_40_14]|nr:MAG: hypothetical protein UT82_C0019G0013 [Parcubacteria group bacterium GW2011_GWB1_40_14]